MALCVLSLCLSLACEAQFVEAPVANPERLEQRVFEYYSALWARDFESAWEIKALRMRFPSFAEWKKQFEDIATSRKGSTLRFCRAPRAFDTYSSMPGHCMGSLDS